MQDEHLKITRMQSNMPASSMKHSLGNALIRHHPWYSEQLFPSIIFFFTAHIAPSVSDLTLFCLHIDFE